MKIGTHREEEEGEVNAQTGWSAFGQDRPKDFHHHNPTVEALGPSPNIRDEEYLPFLANSYRVEFPYLFFFKIKKMKDRLLPMLKEEI